MGIHFVCHHCSYALHVKDFQAGKRGKCPNCNNSFRIPNKDASYSSALEDASENPAVSKVKQAFQVINQVKTPKLASDSSGSISIALEPNPIASKSTPDTKQNVRQESQSKKGGDSPPTNSEKALPAALAVAMDAKWFVRPPSGGQFGPAEASLLINWIAESRVTGDSLLCREGQTQWQTAYELLPELFVVTPPAMSALNSISTDNNHGTSATKPTSVIDQAAIRSGAILKKKMQKRKQQLTMVVLLASISLILFSILIYVLVFQVGKPPAAN